MYNYIPEQPIHKLRLPIIKISPVLDFLNLHIDIDIVVDKKKHATDFWHKRMLKVGSCSKDFFVDSFIQNYVGTYSTVQTVPTRYPVFIGE